MARVLAAISYCSIRPAAMRSRQAQVLADWLRRWAHVRVLNEPEGHVFKIARNERSKRQKQHDCRAKDLHPSPYDAPRAAGDDLAQIVADRVVVLEALRQLPARQREAVILRAVAGLFRSRDRTGDGCQRGLGEALRV